MMRKLAMVMGLIGACNLYAATTTISAPVGVYTQVAGSGGTNQWITAGKDGSYCFSTTQPAASAICHHSSANEYIPISSMGSGIYMWFKPDTQATIVVVTPASDAILLGGSSGLPSGAATSANQSTEITALNTINTTLGSPLQSGGSVVVASAPTTAVTGTFWQATQPVSVASLPLPTGAATASSQTNGTQKTQIVDNSNTNFGTALNPFSVNILSGGGGSSLDVVATGTLAALNDAVTTTQLNGASTLGIEFDGVTGSLVGFVEVDISTDGTTWSEVGVLQYTNGALLTTVGTGDFSGGIQQTILTSVTGAKYARVLLYNYTSGSATVTLRASSGTSPFEFGKMYFLSNISDSVGNIPAPGLSITSQSTPVSLSKDVISDCTGSANPTITTGGASQTLRAANAGDKSIEIYNNSSTEQLCFIYGSTATLNDYCIPPLGYYSNTLNNQLVSVIASTTSHKFKCSVRQ